MCNLGFPSHLWQSFSIDSLLMVLFLRILLLALLVVLTNRVAMATSGVVRVGLVAYTYEGDFTTYIDHEDDMQQELPKIFKKNLPEIEFDIHQYRQSDLHKLIKDGKIDLFLGSSGFYWEMRQYGGRDLATFVSSITPNPNHGNAGVIFTRKERDDINSLNDCKGKVLAAGKRHQFQAHLISLGEFAKQGHDVEDFFAKIIENDLPLRDVVNQVRSGEADVGFLRACVLESRYPNWRDDFKILNPRKTDDMFCVHSTSQYPNATLVALPSLSPEISRRIAGALLSAPPMGQTDYHWSLTTDYGPVDDLYQLLKMGPYLYLREWTIERVINKYWPLFAIFIVALFAGVVYLLRVEDLVRKKTATLLLETQHRQEAESNAHKFEKRANQLQRSVIVGQLSSIFAHELRQPLSIIQNFKDGIDLLIDKVNLDRNKIKLCTNKIQEQVDKIDSVVKRVNAYAKNEPDRSQKVNFSSVCQSVCEAAVSKTNINFTKLITNIQPNLYVKGDPLELEILVTNLIKNAIEATTGNPGNIVVSLGIEGVWICLTVINTGTKLTNEQVRGFSDPFMTTKEEGLGLGLVIVQTIAEAHRGTFSLKPREEGGLEADVQLPIFEESGNGQ